MEMVVCTLCMDVFTISSSELNALGEMVKEMFDVVFSKENFLRIENPVVCKLCKENLQEAFDFKAVGISTEDCLYPYMESDNKEIDLKVVYFKEKIADKTFNFDKNDDVCRFCLSLTKSNTATALKLEIIRYDQFLRIFLPELMLKGTSKAVICECCHVSLEKYVKFVKSCLESKMIQKDETCADRHNESRTNLQIPESNELKSCFIKMKEEPVLNFVHELESLPLKTEQYLDIEEKPPVHMAKATGGKSFKDEYCSSPIYKIENLDDSIELQEIAIKSDNGSECDALDGGIDQKGNIWQIVSDEVGTISVTQEQRSMTKVSCNLELEEIPKDYTELPVHLDQDELFGNGTFQLHMLDNKDISETKMFKCTICNYQAKQKYLLKMHNMLKHKKISELEIFKRGLSDSKSEQKHLTRHIPTLTEALEMKLFKCEMCVYETKRKFNLKMHMLTHKDVSEVKVFKCGVCAYVGKRKLYLDSHIVTHHHHELNIQLFKCEICDYKSKRNSDLKMHMLNHKNSSDIKMYKCGICVYETKRKSHLKPHMLRHKDVSEIKMFKCGMCDYEGKLKSRLKSHMLTHKDESEIEIFKCEFCCYKAKQKHTLKRHVLTHKNASENKMHKCGVCAYESKRKSNLKIHMVTHKDASEMEMFKCGICVYEAKRKSQLKTHMLEHKDVSEIEMFKCVMCDYEGKLKSRLKSHMLTHKDESEIEMFKCEFCSYKAKQKYILKKHVLTHKNASEIKMHKCGVCAFESKRKFNLKIHMVTHKDASEMEMFKCEICEYQAKRKSQLKRHMQNHQGVSNIKVL